MIVSYRPRADGIGEVPAENGLEVRVAGGQP